MKPKNPYPYIIGQAIKNVAKIYISLENHLIDKYLEINGFIHQMMNCFPIPMHYKMSENKQVIVAYKQTSICRHISKCKLSHIYWN